MPAVNPHPAVIEAGPGTLRQLCCTTDVVVDTEIVGVALGAIDDPVALVGDRPIAVASVWSDALSALCQDHGEGAILVHPSWWSATRVGTVTRAARTLPGDVSVRSRSWLLALAQPDALPEARAIVELTDGFAVISGCSRIAAVRRRTDSAAVAEEVAGVVAEMTGVTTVVIDAARGVAAARPLATLIAGAVGAGADRTAVVVDDARLRRLAKGIRPTVCDRVADNPRPRARVPVRLAGTGVALVVVALAVPALTPERRHTAPSAMQLPTTYLVEGRVALAVPANWPTQRVTGGPGSTRIQVTSPSDREIALHITQSPVPGGTLADAADRLQRAIETEPAGVFVDFNPSSASVGRPAVTYREVRDGHDVWWAVLLDGEVRIGIGCQSRPGGWDAVRDVCEQAVRSAHAVE